MINVDRIRLKTTTNYHSCLANKTIASGGEGGRGCARVREIAKGRESFRWLTLKVEGRKKNLSNDFIVNSSAIYRREKDDAIA